MAELSRDVLSAVAHELGGVASALDLRAAALAQVIPDRDAAALRELANELRIATRTVRFVRGADDFGMLNPSRLQSLDEWWKFTRRLTSVVLPRGVSVEATFIEATLTPPQSSALTWQWLAACKEISDLGVMLPCSIVVEGKSVVNGHSAVELTAHVLAQSLASPPDATSRWREFAVKIAAEHGVEVPTWERGDEALRWRCVVTSEVTV